MNHTESSLVSLNLNVSHDGNWCFGGVWTMFNIQLHCFIIFGLFTKEIVVYVIQNLYYFIPALKHKKTICKMFMLLSSMQYE